MTASREFLKPSSAEQFLNRAFGFMVGLGVGPSYCYLLQVRGRKTGKLYSTPVYLMDLQGKLVLVAPRGKTQWVRNAEASGEITLKRGRYRKRFHLEPIGVPEKLAILEQYLNRFKAAVQRYFSVQAGSPPAAFAEVADGFPVFALAEIQRSPPSS
ncbi:MAG TPA: nitroreductase/quinone reductase family protein [Terriglobales bacterium]|jgi:deazaflavin-dependent oxidoreductase (nitroreductase family)|nr:nitroreductase/quinone reductase family protein [Terriglobales bacterium]